MSSCPIEIDSCPFENNKKCWMHFNYSMQLQPIYNNYTLFNRGCMQLQRKRAMQMQRTKVWFPVCTPVPPPTAYSNNFFIESSLRQSWPLEFVSCCCTWYRTIAICLYWNNFITVGPKYTTYLWLKVYFHIQHTIHPHVTTPYFFVVQAPSQPMSDLFNGSSLVKFPQR
jgi:hypothetical protein